MQLEHVPSIPYSCWQEAELIDAAKHGDLEAFNTIVLRYQDLLFRIAYRILADEDAAADAIQDAFIAAFRQIQFVCRSSMKAWLIRIVVNKCKDQLRATARHPSQSLDRFFAENPENDRSTVLEIADKALSVEGHVEMAELESVIHDALDRLPLHLRTMIVLADIERFSYEEISAIEQIPMGTVKSRLVRARLQLRGVLLRHRGFADRPDQAELSKSISFKLEKK